LPPSENPAGRPGHITNFSGFIAAGFPGGPSLGPRGGPPRGPGHPQENYCGANGMFHRRETGWISWKSQNGSRACIFFLAPPYANNSRKRFRQPAGKIGSPRGASTLNSGIKRVLQGGRDGRGRRF
jgi:hypothetical protein